MMPPRGRAHSLVMSEQSDKRLIIVAGGAVMAIGDYGHNDSHIHGRIIRLNKDGYVDFRIAPPDHEAGKEIKIHRLLLSPTSLPKSVFK